MISLIMPPKDQVGLLACCISGGHNFTPKQQLTGCACLSEKPSEPTYHALQVSRAQKMLGDEFGTASNIKNRVNRQSVLGAITSAQQRLKLYNKASDTSSLPGQLIYMGA